MHKIWKFLFAVFLSVFGILGIHMPTAKAQVNNAVFPEILMHSGSGSFWFPTKVSEENKAVKVWYYVPNGDLKTIPILFVMHGTLRNGKTYRDQWTTLADKYHILVVVPEFTKKDFPGSRGYNLGNMFDKEDAELPKNEWSFSLIEPIFDSVVQAISGQQKKYNMYGHSAGAQFVSRYCTFIQNAHVDKAVCANAGWYTMPDFSIKFPYGLKKTSLKPSDSDHLFRTNVYVLLGERDVDPDSKYLRKTKMAEKQGATRFARGNHYFATAKETAEKRRVPFNWTLQTVPGVGHSNKGMAPAAAAIIGHE